MGLLLIETKGHFFYILKYLSVITLSAIASVDSLAAQAFYLYSIITEKRSIWAKFTHF